MPTQEEIEISIHALLAESDSAPSVTPATSRNFYPRSPCGERLPSVPHWSIPHQFLSTLSLRRATNTRSQPSRPRRLFLSTLSLRRATMDSSRAANCQQHFYPRSPCGERLFDAMQIVIVVIFLSTLSLRRATVLVWCSCGGAFDFYPRSPCGERLYHLVSILINPAISIHALLAESDIHQERQDEFYGHFYPRSPCGERQAANGFADAPPEISIHALLAESDVNSISLIKHISGFLSTLSLRRATADPTGG